MTSSSIRHPFFLGLLAVATIAFFALLSGFWQAIFWATVFGILFRPLEVRLSDSLGSRKSLASALTVVIIFFTVLLPAMLVASAVVVEAADLYARIESANFELNAIQKWLETSFPAQVEWISGLGINIAELASNLSQAAVSGSKFIASLALDAGQNVTTFIVMFFLMLYLLFFVLRDGDTMLRFIHDAVPLPDELEKRLFVKFAEVARATIKGTLLIGLLQGFLGGLIFAILGIQGAIFWGVVMVILSLLPAVGSALIWGPAAIYLFVTGDWGKGTILLAYGGLLIGLADNFLRPILVGRDTKMPDYLVLFSTLGGLGLFGITGFVLGPVIAALFLAVWEIYIESPAETTA